MAYLGDLAHNAVNLAAFPTQSVTTGTVAASAVDCQLAEGPMTLLINVGAITGNYSPLQMTLTEGDTSGGSFTAMTEAPASIAIMVASTTYAITFWKRSKRWVKATVVATGGSTALISAVLVAHKKISGSGSGVQT